MEPVGKYGSGESEDLPLITFCFESVSLIGDLINPPKKRGKKISSNVENFFFSVAF